MNTKHWAITILLLVMSLAVSGCGAGQLFGPAKTPTPTPTPTPTSTATPANTPTFVPGHPQAGHWEGTEPSISFDVSSDNTIVNFSATVSFANSFCTIKIPTPAAINSNGTIKMNGDSFNGAVAGAFSGKFTSATTVSGTYWNTLCQGTVLLDFTERPWSATVSAK
jgi:hypothetical protein